MATTRRKPTEKPVRHTHQQRGELELSTNTPPISPGLLNPTNEAPQTLPPAARDRGIGPDGEITRGRAKPAGKRTPRRKTRGGAD
jgi:hypothetical protein